MKATISGVWVEGGIRVKAEAGNDTGNVVTFIRRAIRVARPPDGRIEEVEPELPIGSLSPAEWDRLKTFVDAVFAAGAAAIYPDTR